MVYHSKKSSLVYVNFSPYKNAGKIFDFIISEFDIVCAFCFSFHELKEKDSNKLIIYKRGRAVETHRLVQIPVPESFIFFLLPIRSLFIMVQIFIYVIILRKKFGPIDVYFTVNAFTAWVGMLLRKFGLVKRAVFWVWDYYPPGHENKIIAVMRWAYWHFDKMATQVDKVVFLNRRLITLRKKIKVLDSSKIYEIVPIGTDPVRQRKIKNPKPVILGFIGVLKRSQGLDLIFDQGDALTKRFKNISLEIIGGGPDGAYFRERSKNSPLKVRFHGLQTDSKVKAILQNCTIGVATYIPEKNNVSYYGDPSKIKNYLSVGLPIITTNVFVFSKEIKQSNAGVIINYFNPKELVSAVATITRSYAKYQKSAKSLAEKYNYKKIYSSLFKF